MLIKYKLFEKIASGFQFTEGPVWQFATNTLLFNDIPNGTTYSWSDDLGISVIRKFNNKANGQTFDPVGRLIVCEHLTSSVVRLVNNTQKEILACSFDGKELNSPNDVIVSPDNSIIFTDPPFGRIEEQMGLIREVPQPYSGIYQITSTNEIRLLSKALKQPNGLCLSLDNALLYVNDTLSNTITEYSLSWGAKCGLKIVSSRQFATLKGEGSGSADGMKIDELGNIWCAGPDGIHVFDHSGKQIFVLRVPEKVGNFTWGGLDGHELFITASTSLYRAITNVAGAQWA